MGQYSVLTALLGISLAIMISQRFDWIIHSSHSIWLGPLLVAALLSYLTELPIFLYYRKNSHLNKIPRHLVLTIIRLAAVASLILI